MTLYEKIISIYPELKNKFLPDLGIALQNDSDGKGDYIKVWNHSTLTKPTKNQLDAVTE
jgi:hypothetical protein